MSTPFNRFKKASFTQNYNQVAALITTNFYPLREKLLQKFTLRHMFSQAEKIKSMWWWSV